MERRDRIENIDRTGFGTVMNEFPRLALATPAEDAEPSVACLAMLAGLTERRWRVQHFRTRACPTATEAVGQVTGLPGRHLDAWLMPPEVCRGLFARAAAVGRALDRGRDARRAEVGRFVHVVRFSGRLASGRAGARLAGRRGGLVPCGRRPNRCTCRGCPRESTQCCSTS